jgi:hypothetical protein
MTAKSTAKSLKIFARVLVFGLLLGASSTAYADSVAITSFTFGGITFSPATGTAVFTPTGVSTRAQAQNNLGEFKDITTSNSFPVSQTMALVTFASSAITANATNLTANLNTSVSVGGCTCTAAAFAQGVFTGTLVILGGVGDVDVTFSVTHSATGQEVTDALGIFGFTEVAYNLLVDGRSVLSQDQMLSEIEGPNQMGGFGLGGGVSHVRTLQFGTTYAIEFRLSSVAAANEVTELPEPATVVMLVSGLGFLTGVLKRRRKGGGY